MDFPDGSGRCGRPSGACPDNVPHGDRQTAFELIVVVAVEQVVLAVVLIMQDGLNRAQPGLEQPAFRRTLHPAAIGVAAPGEIGFAPRSLSVSQPRSSISACKPAP